MANVAHPEPTPGTVKALYARAFRCARPDCQRPLYKQDNETGELVLNSRVAHIHARRAGGPRWIEMTADDNRAPGNLLLLCIEHSYEVDDLPERYPAELLREWKDAQLAEYERVQRNWTLSDADAGRVLEASSGAAEHVQAGAVVGAVRAVERLGLAARAGRVVPAERAAAWRAAFTRARAAFVMWDEDGNSIYAEPSTMESETLRAALVSALTAAAADLAPLADDAKVELAAARASRPSVGRWCAWVSRTIDAVLEAASAWPGPPELDDGGRLDDALRALAEASDGLAAAWRGEPEGPPPEPAAAPRPAPDQRDPLQAHRDLLDQARPFTRVDHRPYDPELRALLGSAAEGAATLPPVPSALAIDLSATCRLAAAVAGNADDDELAVLIEQDRRRRPLCAAMLLLEETVGVAEARGRSAPAEQARATLVALWEAVDWSKPDAWGGNEAYGATVFWIASRLSSAEQVRDRLARALSARSDIVLRLVTACAPWEETRDSRDLTRMLGVRRRYAELPPWFPAGGVVAAAAATAPGVAPASDDMDEDDDPESLLAQVLRLARSAGD